MDKRNESSNRTTVSKTTCCHNLQLVYCINNKWKV